MKDLKIDVSSYVKKWKYRTIEAHSGSTISRKLLIVREPSADGTTDPGIDSYIKSIRRFFENTVDIEELSVPINNLKLSLIKACDKVDKVFYILMKPMSSTYLLRAESHMRMFKVIDVENCGGNHQRYSPETKSYNIDLYNYPCTAVAMIKIATEILGISLSGTPVVVIGRSGNVGYPLAYLLNKKYNAVVTTMHSKTPADVMESICKLCGTIFTCAGKDNLLKGEIIGERFADTFKVFKNTEEKKQYVIDAGCNVDADGKLIGDFTPDTHNTSSNTYYTSVPGGVGMVTNLVLLQRVLLY